MFQVVLENRPVNTVCNTLWMFDLDHTLIAPKSGKFAKNEHDYKWLRTIVTDENIDIIIYSNQSKPHDGFMTKVEEICKNISGHCPGANLYFFAAFEKDHFRKPCAKGLLDNFNILGYSLKIFVGDAAGRSDDFSDSDYKFATNIGAYFLVPEAYDLFVKRIKDQTKENSVGPWYSNHTFIKRHIKRSEKKCPEQIDSAVYYIDWTIFSRANNIERYQAILLPLLNKKVIMCGRQGSGKSTFVAVAKSLKMNVTEYRKGQYLRNGTLIDGTFPSKAMRAAYSDATIIFMDTPEDVCRHNRMYRELVHGLAKVPEIAIRVFEKKFEKPTGPNVVTVPFMIDIGAPTDYFKYYY